MAENSPREQTKDGGPDEGVYRPHVVQPPTEKQVDQMASKLNMHFLPGELQEVTASLGGMVGMYDALHRMVAPLPPVKYLRTPGYRPPTVEENKHGAWYMKTEIHGAPEGKLSGKRVALKDNISVAGVAMMNGSRLLEGHVSQYDATVVTRILDAGGVVAGKATCENLCFSGMSVTSDQDAVLNPHDTTRSAGGSSSGSAVLVATGEVDLSVGGDQGGSIRIPAASCGIVGLKPTYGLVPYTGAASTHRCIDYLGPMARTVTECALLLEVLAGRDGMDDRQPEFFPQVPEYSQELKSDLTGVKIGLLQEGFETCHTEVGDIIRKAGERLREKGADVVDISIPIHKHGPVIYSHLLLEGGYNTMLQHGGCGFGSRGFHDTALMDHQTKAVKHSANDLPKGVKLVYLLGEYIKETTNHKYYSHSSNLVMGLTAAYDEALTQVDVLLMPTLPFTASKLPSQKWSYLDVTRDTIGMVNNTCQFNATGHPALTVNGGQLEGLPVGMMLVGNKWKEQIILNTALAHEQLMA